MTRRSSSRHTLSRPPWLACLLAVLALPAVILAGALVIEESGVGTGVEDRELLGKSGSFTEGQKVWFWNLVTGGEAGAKIVHVWLHADKEVHSVELEVGGSRWRTWSNKTLHPGSAGSWAVEARNESGKVLAREVFLCVAAQD